METPVPAPAPTPVNVRPVPIQPAAVTSGARLQYTGVAPVQVKGPQTGRMYVFSRAAPVASVDRRDINGLLRIGLFRRVV
jgi:hypothetical protein